jgi:transcriptional regulator with XRE-family HTH domain
VPTGNMLKAARALAGLTGAQLAAMAEIDVSTISRMESAGHSSVRGQGRTVELVIRALRERGVEITDDGVRLMKRPR